MKSLLLLSSIVGLGLGCHPAEDVVASPQAKDVLAVFAEEFVDIKPGSDGFKPKFRMGPAPGRPVPMKTPFAISRYEVTQELFLRVMGSNPSRWKGDRNAVENMTALEATEFCRRATLLMRRAKLLKQNELLRLPSESEWEYCCRAGTTTLYSFGEKATNGPANEAPAPLLDPYAWHHGNAAGNDPAVGVLKPNPWGLYDVHGYLWEFTTPVGAAARPGSRTVVLRGGSWRDHHSLLTSASRIEIPDHLRSDAVGFRCVKATIP